MLRAITFAVILVLSPLCAAAQQGGVEEVITKQLDAFMADDFDRAFGFASPGIRGMFGTPDRFGAMVRNGYPMVYRPDDVRFLDQDRAGGGIEQRVQIRDAAGAFHVLEYRMIEVDGRWRIDGVRLLETDLLGV